MLTGSYALSQAVILLLILGVFEDVVKEEGQEQTMSFVGFSEGCVCVGWGGVWEAKRLGEIWRENGIYGITID